MLPFCLRVLTYVATAAAGGGRALPGGNVTVPEPDATVVSALRGTVAATRWSTLTAQAALLDDDNHALTGVADAIDAITAVPLLRVCCRRGRSSARKRKGPASSAMLYSRTLVFMWTVEKALSIPLTSHPPFTNERR